MQRDRAHETLASGAITLRTLASRIHDELGEESCEESPYANNGCVVFEQNSCAREQHLLENESNGVTVYSAVHGQMAYSKFDAAAVNNWSVHMQQEASELSAKDTVRGGDISCTDTVNTYCLDACGNGDVYDTMRMRMCEKKEHHQGCGDDVEDLYAERASHVHAAEKSFASSLDGAGAGADADAGFMPKPGDTWYSAVQDAHAHRRALEHGVYQVLSLLQSARSQIAVLEGVNRGLVQELSGVSRLAVCHSDVHTDVKAPCCVKCTEACKDSAPMPCSSIKPSMEQGDLSECRQGVCDTSFSALHLHEVQQSISLQLRETDAAARHGALSSAMVGSCIELHDDANNEEQQYAQRKSQQPEPQPAAAHTHTLHESQQSDAATKEHQPDPCLQADDKTVSQPAALADVTLPLEGRMRQFLQRNAIGKIKERAIKEREFCMTKHSEHDGDVDSGSSSIVQVRNLDAT
jgi:hypothetical protein